MGNLNNYKHGYAGKEKMRLYNTWLNMKQRCSNKNNARYKCYGGRGITICDEWKNNFEAFKDWALSCGYKDTLTIDRIDVYGNYEPLNCRWISNQEQQLNRRDNHNLTYNDETKTISEWSREVGIGIKTIECRLNKGWGVEKALTAPLTPNIKDIKGMKFGKLTVIALDHTDKYAYWLCKCDCGNQKVVRGDILRRGATKSCGCLSKSKVIKDENKNTRQFI